MFAGIFGNIPNPTKYTGTNGEGLFLFISQVFQLLGIVAGLYFAFNLIIAGYGYLSANGDIKKTEQAWNQIWQSILGMVIVSSAFVLASVVGNLFGINIIHPIIKGPNE
jgi:hypothetical protein